MHYAAATEFCGYNQIMLAMNRSLARAPLLFAAACVWCLVSALPAFAQQQPNLSGTWKMNLEKSEFGGMAKPDSATYVLRHTGTKLEIDATQDGKKAHAEFITDGEERMMSSSPETETWVRAYWTGPVLVLESREKARPAHASSGVKWTSRWSLSDDGKMMAVQKHFVTPNGELDQKLIFDKQ